MSFEGLLKSSFNNIIIQSHDIPDADSVASAFGAQTLVKHLTGKQAKIIYCGQEIRKPNVLKMIREFGIEIHKTEERTLGENDLLILVDCQYWESNVTKIEAENIAVIDHHIPTMDSRIVNYSDIDSSLGSCSTLIFQMLLDYDVPINKTLAAALYYGLMTDTLGFQERMSHRDSYMKVYMDQNNLVDPREINRIAKENMTFSDLEAIKHSFSMIHHDVRIDNMIVVEAVDCDPNTLGLIGDLLLEIEGIEIVAVILERSDSFKISLRSISRMFKADELIKVATKGIGFGGGHLDKAGGIILKEKVYSLKTSNDMVNHLSSILMNYMNDYKIVEVGDLEFMADENCEAIKYKKLPIAVSYIDLEEYFGRNDKVMINTYEGAILLDTKETIAIVGPTGEMYPISREDFKNRYSLEPFKETQIANYVLPDLYLPFIKSIRTGKEIKAENVDLFKLCYVIPEGTEILAVKLTKSVKVISKWDRFTTITGKVGDYLVINREDYYVISREIMGLTYRSLAEIVNQVG